MSLRRVISNALIRIWGSHRWCWIFAPFVPMLLMCQLIRSMVSVKRKVTSIPVCVIGNLSVGGNGKTPFTLWLATTLKEKGYHVGIAGKPYLSQKKTQPTVYQDEYPVEFLGDELALLGDHLQCPVAIAATRCDAVKLLAKSHSQLDMILCDDGFQTPDLYRDCSIVLLDPQRVGNGYLLPMGPLRDSWSSLFQADFILQVGFECHSSIAVYKKMAQEVWHHASLRKRPLSDFPEAIVYCAIAHPGPLQDFVKKYIPNIHFEIYDDHAPLQKSLLQSFIAQDRPIIMTEKDWIKIQHDLKAEDPVWVLSLSLEINPTIQKNILNRLKEVICNSHSVNG